jgi:hypothetical protein
MTMLDIDDSTPQLSYSTPRLRKAKVAEPDGSIGWRSVLVLVHDTKVGFGRLDSTGDTGEGHQIHFDRIVTKIRIFLSHVASWDHFYSSDSTMKSFKTIRQKKTVTENEWRLDYRLLVNLGRVNEAERACQGRCSRLER